MQFLLIFFIFPHLGSIREAFLKMQSAQEYLLFEQTSA